MRATLFLAYLFYFFTKYHFVKESSSYTKTLLKYAVLSKPETLKITIDKLTKKTNYKTKECFMFTRYPFFKANELTCFSRPYTMDSPQIL